MNNKVHSEWKLVKEPVTRCLAETFVYSRAFLKEREDEVLNINQNLWITDCFASKHLNTTCLTLGLAAKGKGLSTMTKAKLDKYIVNGFKYWNSMWVWKMYIHNKCKWKIKLVYKNLYFTSLLKVDNDTINITSFMLHFLVI